MDLKDLDLIAGGKLAERLSESFSIATSPRVFIRRVASEPAGATWRRLLTLAVCFSMFEVSLFGLLSAKSSDLSVFRLIGLSIVEFCLSAAAVPVFYAVAKFVHSRAAFRVAAAWAITFRFVLLMPPLILMFAFLMSENYLFAFLKGCASWLYVIAFILVYPIAASRSLRQSVLAVTISATAFVAFVVVVTLSLSAFPPSPKKLLVPLLDDPIAAEIWHANLLAINLGSGALDSAHDALQALAAAQRRGDWPPKNAEVKAKDVYLLAWPRRQAQIDSSLSNAIVRLDSIRDSAEFETTRHLAARFSEAAQTTRAAANISGSFIFGHDQVTYRGYQNAIIQAQRAQIDAYKAYSAFIEPFVLLERWQLLTCDCETESDSGKRP